MKPYYDDGTVTIFCCDYAAVIDSLPSDVALVTDPPYGIGYKPGGQASGKGRNGAAVRRLKQEVVGDHAPFTPERFLSYPEIIMWGANHYADKLPASPSWLVWDKRKGTKSDNHADCEMAWTNLGGPARLWSQLWRGMIREGEHNATPRLHPTQKPEALMRWCIQFTSKQTILDPFMGSGTTLKAAKDLGRKAIGVEIEERYCEAAASRLSQEVLAI